MATPAVPRGPSGISDQPNFRNDAPLSGLEIWLNGTHTELDAALTVLAGAGRLAWRSERRRLHGPGDAGRHSVYVRITVADTERPKPSRRPAPTGDLLDPESA